MAIGDTLLTSAAALAHWIRFWLNQLHWLTCYLQRIPKDFFLPFRRRSRPNINKTEDPSVPADGKDYNEGKLGPNSQELS